MLMVITEVVVHTVPMSASWLTEGLIANPMSGYPQYRERRASWFGSMTAAVVELRAGEGLSGLGYVGGGKGGAAKSVVEEHFAQLLTGQDPFDIERLWDQLYRASVMYGRRGLALEALSAVDIALWDLVGKAAGQPVYRLIGGRTKPRLRAYVTGNLTERHLAEGFRDVKLALPHGPADGEAGLRANEDLVRRTRERIGPEGDLMLDCYMALDVPYTIELARRLRDYRIRWIEEPVLPDQIDSYRRIRDAIDIPIAGGEHEFTRFGFRELIEKRAVDILQPDIYRAGGISELKKIAAMASACDIPVIPHGVGAPTYHFVMSTVNAPKVEFVDIFASGGELLLEGEPVPRGGWVELGGEPGFGYQLNPRALRGEVPVAPIW
jgi:L-rhamnonate dehydratase